MHADQRNYQLRTPAPRDLAVLTADGEPMHISPEWLAAHHWECTPSSGEIGFVPAGAVAPQALAGVSVYTIEDALESWRWYVDAMMSGDAAPGDAPWFSLAEIADVRSGARSHVVNVRGALGLPVVDDGLLTDFEAAEDARYVVRLVVLLSAPKCNTETAWQACRLALDHFTLQAFRRFSPVEEYSVPAGLGEAEVTFADEDLATAIYAATTPIAFQTAVLRRRARYQSLLGGLHARIASERLTTRNEGYLVAEWAERFYQDVLDGKMLPPGRTSLSTAGDAPYEAPLTDTRAWQPLTDATLVAVISSLRPFVAEFPSLCITQALAIAAPADEADDAPRRQTAGTFRGALQLL